MAEKMNVQIAAWCHFYWKSTNPGGERFYRKLSNRAFNQVMHEISECEWDDKTRMVTSPTLRSKLSAVIEFENQDWVKNLTQAGNSTPKKNFVNPNAAFPFQEDFSVGTIHGSNISKPPSKDKNEEEAEVIETEDNDDDVSILTTKTQDELLALLLQERRKSKSAIGRRAASGTDTLVSGPTADATPAGETGTAPVAAEGSQTSNSTGNEGRVDGGPVGE
jgi:hypothetical protein